MENTERNILPNAGEQPKKSAWKVPGVIAAVIAAVLTLVAWLSMVYSEYVSFYTAFGALALSMLAIIVLRRSLARDIAITSLIASGVLLLVYGIFFYGINLLIGEL